MFDSLIRRSFLKAAAVCGLGAPLAVAGVKVPEGQLTGISSGSSDAAFRTPSFASLKSFLDSIPAIDTHDHLHPFDQLPGLVETERGRGVNLYGLWKSSYLTKIDNLAEWRDAEPFESWWTRAKEDFKNVHATGFYRYMHTSFKDLYGVDFDRISDSKAKVLDQRIFENYRDERWLFHVITDRANIELMFIDPFWARFDFRISYPFQVLVFNVTTLTRGFHASEFDGHPFDDPFVFARTQGLPPVKSLDDYLSLLDQMFTIAKKNGAACLKTTAAYERTLQFDDVPKGRATRVFGHPRSALAAADVKEFEDFIMWRLVELSAKHDLPFQIHTGDARIGGSSPMFLVNLIDANPRTKFILFHGGFPWVGETGAIVQKYPDRVWIDSVWLPTISFTLAKRAYHEWLEVLPSNRIMWGSDDYSAEGIFGETELTRRCLAEVLAEKVDRGDLPDWYARQIGKQILRDNALELFPQLQARIVKEEVGQHQVQRHGP